MSIKNVISIVIFSLLTSFSVADEEYEEVNEEDNKMGFAVGLGIPYGGLGINISRDISETVEITGGLGVFGWAIGARFYPSIETPTFRLSGIYGTNSIVIVDECGYTSGSSYCSSEFKSYEGMNFGIGFGPHGNDDGWNFDVILILTRGNLNEFIDEKESEGYDIESDDGVIKFSGGYTWRF